MFSNGHKSEVGQPYQCWMCNNVFERIADDDEEICKRCDNEKEE